MKISQRIRSVREKEGLTRKALSEAVGISVNTLDAIEQRGQTPRADLLEKIARTYPKYAMWLLLEEERHLAALDAPKVDIYQIIDSCDPRHLNRVAIKSTLIERVVFLQTAKLENFADDWDFGTAILLILPSRAGRCQQRAVLLEDGYVDICDIIKKGRVSGVLAELMNWFQDASIRNFEIKAVSYKTLRLLSQYTDDLRLSDLEDAEKYTPEAYQAFQKWQELVKE